MNFSAVDLNLLRIFHVMMIELSTVRAGERVSLSQPAVSSASGRLRHLTGDELFVRDGNRMVPTPRALQLRDPVSTALRQIEAALSSAANFNPNHLPTGLQATRIGLILDSPDAAPRHAGHT